MPRQRDARGVAAECRDMVARPAHRLRAVLQHRGEADLRHLAIVGHHHDEPGTRESTRGKGVGGAVALHPAAAVPEDHDRQPARRRRRGPPDVERHAVVSERHRVARLRHARAAARRGVEQAEQLGRRGERDDQPQRRGQRQHRAEQPADQTTYCAVVLAATSSAATPGAISIRRNGDW